MKCKIISILIVILALTNSSNAKGGRGGFSARGGGSRGGGSKSGGGGGFSSWFSGGSKPAPARPSPSYTYSAPSPSYSHNVPAPSNNAPSYGWNVNRGGSNTQSNAGSNYGWNVGSNSGNSNTGSKQSNTNYGWNTNNNNNAPKPSAPNGPPPAYPGMQNRPVPNNNAPPAYSPSNVNPPAYNPAYNPGSYNAYSPSINSRPGNNYGGNIPRQNTYNSYSSNTGYNPGGSYYGNTFGSQGLPGNTYISNNYYGNQRSGGSGFLTNALFFGMGMHSGYGWGRSSGYDSSYNRRRWDEEEDRKWRATTQAPYFENKVPGEDKILPASAVIGAATAFGLVSLLPLNVPANKPLMYCNNTELMQSQIQINNENIYQCINNTIEMSCSGKVSLVNATEVHENKTECVNRSMQCDLKDEEIVGSVYCSNGTLLSKNFIFCNSTTLLNGTNLNETTTILNCYEGQIPESQAAFIPTTTTTQAPITTTEKSLSFGAKVHMFFLRVIGKGNVAEESKTTTPIPEVTTVQNSWVPEALTIPPETTTISPPETTATEAEFQWMEKVPVKHENGTYGTKLQPVSQQLLDMHKTANEFFTSLGDKEGMTYPQQWTKVYVTKSMESTTAASSSSDDTTIVISDNSTTAEPKSN